MTEQKQTEPSSKDEQLLFVYGTLKRGGENHRQLADQRYIGEGRTIAAYRLYQLDGYPGIVADPRRGVAVSGEVWAVSPAALARLDAFEGVGEGLYSRVRVALQPPFQGESVDTYVYARSIDGREDLGERWGDRR